MLNLSGQTAIVTGASRGIGRAIATKLLRQGAVVHVWARNAQGVEEAVQALVAETNGIVHGQALDIGSAAEVDQAVAAALKLTPTIEILVNNAGITKDGLLLRMKESDFDEVMRINLKSVFLTTKALFRTFIKQRYGRIVNLTSIVGIHGQAGQANYAASKAGIIGFTKSTALEAASRGVTCNAVAPGFIESDMTSILNEVQKAEILTKIPLGRMGKAEEIADLVTFLASKEAGYITGQVLSSDGGMGI